MGRAKKFLESFDIVPVEGDIEEEENDLPVKFEIGFTGIICEVGLDFNKKLPKDKLQAIQERLSLKLNESGLKIRDIGVNEKNIVVICSSTELINASKNTAKSIQETIKQNINEGDFKKEEDHG